MTTNSVTLELPETLYHQLETLAQQKDLSPVCLIELWLEIDQQQPSFQQKWTDLRTLIQTQGGLNVGETKEEIIEKLRQTRQEIFEEDYAHLYR